MTELPAGFVLDQSAAPALDPRARDLAIRTIYGEASGEPDQGMEGIAHVIRNRLNAGKFGKSVPEIVLAKGQFEPWERRRAELVALKQDDPAYQRIGGIVDRAFSGQGEDPTKGGTHFFSPSAQAALGRPAPDWATGEPVMIGGHAFYLPSTPIGGAPGRQQPQQAAGGLPPGFVLDQGPAAAGLPAGAAPAAAGSGFDERFGGEPVAASQRNAPLAAGLETRAETMRPSVPVDMAKSLAGGLARGVVRGTGLTGDARELIEAGLGKLGFTPEAIRRFMPTVMRVAPTGRQALEAVEGVAGQIYQPKTTAGEYANTVGEFLPAAVAGPGGIARRVVTQAVAPALSSETAGQATKGTVAEPWARAAGAVVGGLAPSAGGRMVSPFQASPEHTKFVDILRREGIKSTAGQATGNRVLKVAESEIGGAKAARMAEQQGEQFTAAVLRRIGERSSRATPELFARVSDRLGQVFERTAKALPIKHDQELFNDLSKIRQSLLSEGLPEDTIKRITQQISNIEKGFGANPKLGPNVMGGDTYQGLTRKNTPLARAIEDRDPNISYYAGKVRDALDGALERTAFGQGTQPGKGRRAAFEQLRNARNQWRSMMVIRNAVARAGSATAEGLISPQALRGALEKSEYVLGRGNLAELARAGEAVLKPVATSETAIRSAVRGHAHIGALGGLATGGVAGAAVGALAPWAVGRTMMSRPVQSYLSNQAAAPNISGMTPGRNALLQSLLTVPRGQVPIPQPVPDVERQHRR